MKNLNKFIAQLKSGKGIDSLAREDDDVRCVVESVDSFLREQHLVDANTENKLGLESLTEVKSLNLQDITHLDESAITALVEAAGVPEGLRDMACEDIAVCLHDISTNRYNFASHTATTRPSTSAAESVSYTALFGSIAAGRIAAEHDVGLATESFGVDIDTNMFDARTAIVVRLMRFHKSIIDRILPRRPVDNDHIIITVPNSEVYDLEKSANRSAAVRFGDHVKPMIALKRDPSAVDTTAKKVKLLLDNAKGGELIADDIIAVGAELNVFDLATDENVVSTATTDWTDLLSDGVLLDKIYVEVTRTPASGSPVTEVFAFAAHQPTCAFTAPANNTLASDRVANYNSVYYVGNGQLLADGVTHSAVLADLDDNHIFQMKLQMAVSINLQDGNLSCAGGTVRAVLANKTGDEVEPAQQAIANELSFKVKSYGITAYYSEENLRKAKLAARMTQRQISLNLPLGRTILVEYSVQQNAAADVLATVNEFNSLGNDQRALSLIEAAIVTAGLRISDEAGNPIPNYRTSFAYNTAAGNMVYPYVIRTSIDVASLLANLTSSDLMFDVAGMVQFWLLEKFAQIEWNSMFSHQVPEGQKVRWKCLTSEIVRKMLLSMPTKNNHEIAAPAEGAEMAITLADTTVIDVVTTTFKDYKNRMLFVPVIPEDRESILNFGNNWDRGTWVAHYNYTSEGAATKRIATNPREMVFPTNYVAMTVDVANLDLLMKAAGTITVDGAISTNP